jgi:protein TonB
MAPLETLPPETENPRATGEPVHLSGEIKEESVFTTLIANFRDTFFAPKLPPLVLESKPIYFADPMATKITKKSVALSVATYSALLLLLWILIRQHVQLTAPMQKPMLLTDLKVPPPRIPPTAGHLPKLAQEQIVPPKAPPTIPPKLAVEPTVVVQPDLKMTNNTMPNMGSPTSSLKGFSMGNGGGGGIGSGNGNGIGPGSGGNTGGGVYHVGGGVKPPVLLSSPDPEFSEEARKAKFSGNVEVYLIVDENGNPTHVKVARPIGMGLDEKAVEAVRQYKFKPAMKDGKPVKVDMYVDVNFQIF